MTCYDGFAETFSQSRKGMFWPELFDIIAKISNSENPAILDIGCGNGRFLEAWYRQNGQNLRYTWWKKQHVYTGIDLSEGLIKEAQKLHPEHSFLVGDMRSVASWAPHLWWVVSDIVMLASYHHLTSVDDRKKTLSALRSLLLPGGHLYMTNWNLRDQHRYHDTHIWDGVYQIKIGAYMRYYYAFTLEEIAWIAEESGYVVVENRIFDGWRNLYTILQNPY